MLQGKSGIPLRRIPGCCDPQQGWRQDWNAPRGKTPHGAILIRAHSCSFARPLWLSFYPVPRVQSPVLACHYWLLATGYWLPRPRQRYLLRSTRLVFCSSGFQRSPVLANRLRTLSILKSSIRTPASISSQVTGVETGARGRGRTEYTDASVRPHAFWL